MALNIKNTEVERLADQVARMSGETKTEAIRRALLDRRSRLELRVETRTRGDRIRRMMQEEIWPRVPAAVRGKSVSKEEREAILGIGEDGT